MKLGACAEFVTAHTTTTATSRDLVQGLITAKSAGVTITQQLVLSVWGRMVKSAWNSRAFEEWAALFDICYAQHPLPGELRALVEKESCEKFVEENIMNCLVEYLRLSAQSDLVRAAAAPLLKVAQTTFSEMAFQADLIDFLNIALVGQCASDTLEALKAKKDAMTTASSESRFTVPLRLFGTGQDLAAEVDTQFIAYTKDKALAKDLQDLRDFAVTMVEATVKPEQVMPSGFRKFSEDQVTFYKKKFEDWTVLLKKGSQRFLKDHEKSFSEIQDHMSKLPQVVEVGVKTNYGAILGQALDKNSVHFERRSGTVKVFISRST